MLEQYSHPALHSFHCYDYTWSVTDRSGFHCRLIITLAVHKSKIMCVVCAKESNTLGCAYENTTHLLTCVQISFTKKRNKNTCIAQWTSDTTRKKSRVQTTSKGCEPERKRKQTRNYLQWTPTCGSDRENVNTRLRLHTPQDSPLSPVLKGQIRLCTMEIFWALTFLPGLCRETTNPFDTSPWHHLCSKTV